MWYSAVGCIVTLTLSLLAVPQRPAAKRQATQKAPRPSGVSRTWGGQG